MIGYYFLQNERCKWIMIRRRTFRLKTVKLIPYFSKSRCNYKTLKIKVTISITIAVEMAKIFSHLQSRKCPMVSVGQTQSSTVGK